ncbi:hypothetical protein [Acidovorax sp. Root219]|uniref:hypothetical protein n=1 Tax=Acidovorax sp. Root219 TaxID=1736493 RepID=UPI0012F7869E|nr:hypothetical protein [Acidovorax sp. Root219]
MIVDSTKGAEGAGKAHCADKRRKSFLLRTTIKLFLYWQGMGLRIRERAFGK